MYKNNKIYIISFLSKLMEKDIGRISKSETSDVVIRVDDFGGKKGVTIREFVTSDRYTGFTKQGVRISALDFPKFKEMINSITETDLKDEASTSDKKAKPSSQEKLEVEEEVVDY